MLLVTFLFKLFVIYLNIMFCLYLHLFRCTYSHCCFYEKMPYVKKHLALSCNNISLNNWNKLFFCNPAGKWAKIFFTFAESVFLAFQCLPEPCFTMRISDTHLTSRFCCKITLLHVNSFSLLIMTMYKKYQKMLHIWYENYFLHLQMKLLLYIWKMWF